MSPQFLLKYHYKKNEKNKTDSNHYLWYWDHPL